MPVVQLILIFSTFLFMGCGASVGQSQQLPMIAQIQSQTKERSVNNNLLQQATLPSYAKIQDYGVGPEDLLDVRVFGQDNLNREVRVNGQGEISLPLVGSILVEGLSPQKIEQRLMEAYGTQFLRDPQITVSIKEYRHQRVAVTGAVDKPGHYEMIGTRTLLEMLAQAGGLQDKPGAKAGDAVHVIRSQNQTHLSRNKATKASSQPFAPNAETLVINLRKLLIDGDLKLNVPIRHGDVIYVPFAGNAYVLGGVRKPGSVPVKEDLTLAQAIAQAGGIDPVLASDKVDILRLDEKGHPTTISSSVKRVLAQQDPDVPLKENDVVVVAESSFKKGLFVFKELMPGAISGSYRMVP